MPIYEYRCNNCGRRVDVFARSHSATLSPNCTRCDSRDLTRIFSKFAVRKSKSDLGIYDDILSDGKLTRGLMRNDPRALAEWSRKMSRAADEDTSPETDEIMDRLDAGADVSELIETMKPPELRGEEESV